jgi:hypothetical protein
MKTGSIGLCFGYLAQRRRKAADGANELLAIDLFEISLTPGPSNPATAVLSMKSAEPNLDLDLDRVQERDSMLALWTAADQKALELERRRTAPIQIARFDA